MSLVLFFELLNFFARVRRLEFSSLIWEGLSLEMRLSYSCLRDALTDCARVFQVYTKISFGWESDRWTNLFLRIRECSPCCTHLSNTIFCAYSFDGLQLTLKEDRVPRETAWGRDIKNFRTRRFLGLFSDFAGFLFNWFLRPGFSFYCCLLLHDCFLLGRCHVTSP